MKEVYYIGGSPCSGKSTVAEAIAHKFNFTYFKVDDFLDTYTSRGAAFLPDLMKSQNINQEHYVSITPTPEFQILHYKQRPWVPYALHGCGNKEKAFMNWMDRDILFADAVWKQCKETGYTSFMNDGSMSVEELVENVCLQYERKET